MAIALYCENTAPSEDRNPRPPCRRLRHRLVVAVRDDDHAEVIYRRLRRRRARCWKCGSPMVYATHRKVVVV